MKFDICLKIICISILFLYACTSNQLTNTADSCIIFDQKKNWYKATKKSYDKWDTAIAFQLAVIKQESSFTQFAKPKRKKLLGFIPSARPSTAFVMHKLLILLGTGIKTKQEIKMHQGLILMM